MKSLILVAVILQLVIIGIETVDEYQFGDIIEFPRKSFWNKPTYSHFAVYVGPESGVNVGQGDNDIFHRVGKLGKPDCTFGKLAEVRQGSKDKVNNYLDSYIPAEFRSPDKIKERINQKTGEECGKYKLLKNNCEHLATYVRYEEPLSLQKGTCAGCVFNNAIEEEIRKKYEDVLKRDSSTHEETDENNNALCTSDAGKKVSWWPFCLAFFCIILFGLCVYLWMKPFIKKRKEYSQERV